MHGILVGARLFGGRTRRTTAAEAEFQRPWNFKTTPRRPEEASLDPLGRWRTSSTLKAEISVGLWRFHPRQEQCESRRTAGCASASTSAAQQPNPLYSYSICWYWARARQTPLCSQRSLRSSWHESSQQKHKCKTSEPVKGTANLCVQKAHA